MAERLTFTLEGRDHLSRVLGHAGDSADRLRRSMEDASDGSGRAMLTLTRDADGRLRDLEGRFISTADAAALMATRTGEAARPVADWSRAAEEASRAGAELRSSLLSLAPAAIPMAAAIAPIAASTLAAGAGLAALGLATGRQVAAMSEATKAEQKHQDAVEESGRTSADAIKTQVAYAKQMAKLPPATREAAAALSVFQDEYEGWSDSLAEDTTAPLIKGMGVLQGIFPKLTPTVKGAAEQLDRMLTIAGGGVASPGFDGFMTKVDQWSTGTLTRAVDGLVRLMRTAEEGDVGGGLADFMDWARQQGPAVSATLQDLGRALLNVLEAGADVGVGMLAVVQVLSRLVGAVPPEALTALFQLAIAIKVVSLAVAGTVAAKAAMAAFGAQIMMMRTAAAGAPGPLAAAGAAITGLSRTAKIALAGTGLGLLVIVLSELSQAGKQTPPDVDKLTGSLKELGASGKTTGEAARVFGNDLGGLYDKVRTLTDPSAVDSIQQWIVTLGGLGTWDSTPVKEGKENLDAVDKALAGMVSSGNADLATAALKELTAEYGKGGRDTKQFTQELDDYEAAIADAAFEQRLAAQSMGLFGAQAMETKQKLDAQKMGVEGLRQSLHALNETTLNARSASRGMEAAIDAANEALKKNGKSLDDNTAKGRANNQALDDIASATMKAVEAKYQETGSWTESMAVWERGRGQLVAVATQIKGNEQAAKKLADQILRTPNKTAMLRGNMEDLQKKLDSAKSQLGKVPDARKAQVRANIAQLEAQLAEARRKLNAIDGTVATASVMVTYRQQNSGASDFTKMIGGYASGGDPKPGETFWVGERGPELMQLGRGGGAHVYDHRTSMGMVRQLGAGQDVGAGLIAGMSQSRTGVEQSARDMAAGVDAGIRAELEIASPSRKTRRSGNEAGRGVIRGLDDQKPKLAQNLAALMADLKNGIIRGLTGSKSQIQATAADLIKDIWKAFSGWKTNKDSDLVKFVNKEHDKLQQLASKRDRLKARITSAKATLKTRIEEQANYRAGVKATAQGASSLSSLGLEQKEVTAGSIRAGLAQKLVKLRQFNRYITALSKRGLNKNLLRQLLAMGPEEGFAYAAALAGMTNADFKQVNSLQSQIDTEADSLGRAGAKTLYDAGVNSAKGLVAGLQSQQKAVEQQMVTIAKGMEKAIKKALGINSPSRVGHGIGSNFGRSTGDGALAELPYVGRAVDAVAGRMASMRPMPGLPAAGLGVSASAGGGSPVYITVQGAIDPVSTAKQLQRVLVTLRRTNGGGGLSLG
ncbi:hypothetical protein R1T08_24115 [Streptomyces sp. SBC-4]|nr:hypothetical protein [Streptomyces sp. SBC-4]MDV5147176.1 hypothetical protein [Streptomyces sp. SBC-4]